VKERKLASWLEEYATRPVGTPMPLEACVCVSAPVKYIVAWSAYETYNYINLAIAAED
jgi:hypothetical protein